MLTNKDMQLSETQLQQYNEWADASEALSITLGFSFCFLGRTIKAAVDGGQQALILEDCIE